MDSRISRLCAALMMSVAALLVGCGPDTPERDGVASAAVEANIPAAPMKRVEAMIRRSMLPRPRAGFAPRKAQRDSARDFGPAREDLRRKACHRVPTDASDTSHSGVTQA